MASQHAYARSGDSSYVGGEFGFLAPLEQFLEDATELVSEAIEDALNIARMEAYEAAQRDPQWREFADMIDVEYENGSFRYVLNSDDEDRLQAALDLEYGDADGFNGPRPLIRKLAHRQPGAMVNQINNALVSEVPIG